MVAYIITESNFDAAFLLHLLDDRDLSAVEIRATSASYSLARTFLVERRAPVALVLAAHSSEPEVATRRLQEADEALEDVSPRSNFRVFVVSPELESWFFLRPELLRRLFGDDAVTDHLLELARYSARAALRKLDPGADYEALRWRVMRSMTPEDLATLRQADVVGELVRFIAWARQRSLATVPRA